MTEAFYSLREKITPIKKIAVVGANCSRPDNRGAIFSQTGIMNKLPRGEFFMLGTHEKNAPLC